MTTFLNQVLHGNSQEVLWLADALVHGYCLQENQVMPHSHILILHGLRVQCFSHQ